MEKEEKKQNYKAWVSVIIPVKNCAKFLEDCFQSILNQSINEKQFDIRNSLLMDIPTRVEVSIWDDHSTDNSKEIIMEWLPKFKERGILTSFNFDEQEKRTGCGFAKNRAVFFSSGMFLCFQDADDKMLPKRIELQLKAALEYKETLIGSGFIRDPPNATPRYTHWCNTISQEHLYLHQYRECTIAQPTWFCSRELFDRVGGYDESGPGTPEDLLFFHKHLNMDGKLKKELVVYRYHSDATSHGIHRLKLMEIRLSYFEQRVLSKWNNFTIWGVGRDGRKFFMTLSDTNKRKVKAFCDVDPKKIGTNFIAPYSNIKVYEIIERITTVNRPIIHFSEAKPPIVICVALDRTDGEFEANVTSLKLVEGIDYYHFS